VDPGSLVTGWGLLAGSPHRPGLVDCGVIRMKAAQPLPQRLHALRTEFEGIVERLKPHAAAVEAPFHGANARAALQLAHARGVILAVLGGGGVPVVEYSPATIKKAVTGQGHADKEQVQSMVRRLLDERSARAWATDISDALAVALCHLATTRFQNAVSRAGRPRR
jgi:crossover junction endodeoxyribonuclease RuvC